MAPAYRVSVRSNNGSLEKERVHQQEVLPVAAVSDDDDDDPSEAAVFAAETTEEEEESDVQSAEEEEEEEEEEVLESWRKRGQKLRNEIQQRDEQQGGQSFVLSQECPIQRYYGVADKVMDQFLHHPIDSREELLESYLVGKRLVKFLSSILPTHADYFCADDDTELCQARERSQEQLVAVLKYLDQIALLIDKQEHEDYISSVIGASNEDQGDESEEEEDEDENESEEEETQTETVGSSAVNNTTITTKTSHQLPSYDPDRSLVTDSIEVSTVTGKSVGSGVLLQEDPASTPTNTILRMVETPENSIITNGTSTTTATSRSTAPKQLAVPMTVKGGKKPKRSSLPLPHKKPSKKEEPRTVAMARATVIPEEEEDEEQEMSGRRRTSPVTVSSVGRRSPSPLKPSQVRGSAEWIKEDLGRTEEELSEAPMSKSSELTVTSEDFAKAGKPPVTVTPNDGGLRLSAPASDHDLPIDMEDDDYEEEEESKSVPASPVATGRNPSPHGSPQEELVHLRYQHDEEDFLYESAQSSPRNVSYGPRDVSPESDANRKASFAASLAKFQEPERNRDYNSPNRQLKEVYTSNYTESPIKSNVETEVLSIQSKRSVDRMDGVSVGSSQVAVLSGRSRVSADEEATMARLEGTKEDEEESIFETEEQDKIALPATETTKPNVSSKLDVFTDSRGFPELDGYQNLSSERDGSPEKIRIVGKALPQQNASASSSSFQSSSSSSYAPSDTNWNIDDDDDFPKKAKIEDRIVAAASKRAAELNGNRANPLLYAPSAADWSMDKSTEVEEEPEEAHLPSASMETQNSNVIRDFEPRLQEESAEIETPAPVVGSRVSNNNSSTSSSSYVPSDREWSVDSKDGSVVPSSSHDSKKKKTVAALDVAPVELPKEGCTSANSKDFRSISGSAEAEKETIAVLDVAPTEQVKEHSMSVGSKDLMPILGTIEGKKKETIGTPDVAPAERKDRSMSIGSKDFTPISWEPEVVLSTSKNASCESSDFPDDPKQNVSTDSRDFLFRGSEPPPRNSSIGVGIPMKESFAPKKQDASGYYITDKGISFSTSFLYVLSGDQRPEIAPNKRSLPSPPAREPVRPSTPPLKNELLVSSVLSSGFDSNEYGLAAEPGESDAAWDVLLFGTAPAKQADDKVEEKKKFVDAVWPSEVNGNLSIREGPVLREEPSPFMIESKAEHRLKHKDQMEEIREPPPKLITPLVKKKSGKPPITPILPPISSKKFGSKRALSSSAKVSTHSPEAKSKIKALSSSTVDTHSPELKSKRHGIQSSAKSPSSVLDLNHFQSERPPPSKPPRCSSNTLFHKMVRRFHPKKSSETSYETYQTSGPNDSFSEASLLHSNITKRRSRPASLRKCVRCLLK